ncbi:Pkinase-domain-containing protein [Serendipita vermifera]|nr:Pkinase-domain-containing protein [Serendipita vermifera]
MMGGRGRAQSLNANANSKAQLIAAYNELGKELSDTRTRVVGNYTIGRAIGEGAFGKVRIGTHRLTGVRVALKQIPKAVSASLTREIHHHRQLHHPHIAQLYEVIATETSIWLVTELCSGGELFDYLAEKTRFDEFEARALFGQICLAVAYCHDQGVVHRDLKLENVLLDDHCNVKLSDFGFTREYDRGSLLETYCGTAGYASPEMISGQKYLGQEADIWSLGVILYALLTGTMPFDDDDEEAIKRKVLAGEYEDPEWLSPEPRELIKSILIVDPLKRPSLQQILSNPWFSRILLPFSPLVENIELPLDLSKVDVNSSRPASVLMEPGRISMSSNVTDGRPSTPPNQTGANAVTDDTPRPLQVADVDTNPSPSRPVYERKNSATSVAPPLPTRTPVRTKRRSVSSTISPPNTPRMRPSSAILTASAPIDFVNAMTRQRAIVFSTPQERAMLSALAALGFDTGQIVHSVLTNACDSSGALWWIMRKKVGHTYGISEEQNSSALTADPFSEPAPSGKPRADVTGSDAEDGGVAVDSNRPPVLLEDVDESKKRKRSMSQTQPDVKPSGKKPAMSPPPEFAIVPATPIAAEMQSKHVEQPSTHSLSPTRVSMTSYDSRGQNPVNTPPNSKGAGTKARTGSISMLQRATTVLGGAAGLVRKKSEEGVLNNVASNSKGDKDKSFEEPRSSSGSGGRLTKSPPPGKISKEAKEREREIMGDASSLTKSPISEGTNSSTYPKHVKSQSAMLISPTTRRSVTEGGRPASPLLTRELAKPRNRASLLSTFRTWFDDGRRKRKTGSSFSTPSGSTGPFSPSTSTSATAGYFPSGGNLAGAMERPYPRKRTSSGKGTGPRKAGRSHKDKRQSISSKRSSSVNSRRSSVGSMASMGNMGATLGSVGEYTVYSAPLTRKMSDGSKRSYGNKTPGDEDFFDPSRPGSARSFSQGGNLSTGIARRGKRHSKSSSTSSGGSLGRRGGGSTNRPPSRSETTSPTSGRAHRRAGSGSSQTRVVKHRVKTSTSISKGLSSTSEVPASTPKRGRSGSVSSARTGGSSVQDEDAEFGGLRTSSPISRPSRTVMLAQKKHSAYGAPGGSLGYGSNRSSWKKSWGLEPPGWANRGTHQAVVVEVLDIRPNKGNIRDVFAGGGKSGVAPGTTPPDDGNDDDWSDVDDETGYAGGLGQMGSGHTAQNTINPPDSPLMAFTNSQAGRRTKRVPGGVNTNASKAGGSPLLSNNALPSSSTSTGTSAVGLDGIGLDRSGSRRQLPGNRPNFRGSAIVEEEEEEEEE